MKKLLFTALFFTLSFSTGHGLAASIGQRLLDFKRDLNDCLGTQNNYIYIITVSRTTNYGKCCIIELEKLNRILNAIGHITVDGANICRDHSNIVIFNEAFFGQQLPILGRSLTNIQNYLIRHTETYKKSIIYANFLQMQLHLNLTDAAYARMVNLLEYALINQKIYSSAINANYLNGIRDNYRLPRLPPVFGRPIIGNGIPVLANITYCYNNSRILTAYKKSSYFQEADELLLRRLIVYDIGDGIDHDIANTQLSNTLIKNISSQICYDVSTDTRNVRTGMFLKNNQTAESVFHIVQSNVLDICQSVVSQNFPKNKVLIHVDPLYSKNSYEMKKMDDIMSFGGLAGNVNGIMKCGERAVIDMEDERTNRWSMYCFRVYRF